MLFLDSKSAVALQGLGSISHDVPLGADKLVKALCLHLDSEVGNDDSMKDDSIWSLLAGE